MPIVPGTTEPVATSTTRARSSTKTIGYPGRGQGRGRRRRQGLPRRADATTSWRTPSRAPRARARSSSPTPTVYLERYLPDPRHVEVQVLADTHGNVIHLGERDCSIQRRHQKLIEESPAPAGRRRSCASASARSRSTPRRPSTTSAPARSRGCSQDGEYFFLEMNTRVQVEHCVTEMTTGHRHRQGGHPRRRRRAAVRSPRRTSCCAATRSSAASTPRTPRKNFAPAPGQDRRLPRAVRARACASTRASAPAARSRRCTTRWSPS